MKPMLARKWKETTNPRGWWMSEKLDGIRAIWTGDKFISRSGKDFTPPAWFTAQMPNCILDGEFFLGRGMFQEAQSVIMAKSDREILQIPTISPATFDPKLSRFLDIITRLPFCVSTKHSSLVFEKPDSNNTLSLGDSKQAASARRS